MKIIEYCEIKHRTFVDENRNTEKLSIGLSLIKIEEYGEMKHGTLLMKIGILMN